MATLLASCCLFVVHAFVAQGAPTPQIFEQKLDHFSSNENVWSQRYTVNDTFWTPGTNAPVFFFLSGEAPMEFFEFQEVQIVKWAQQFGALYYVLEHRFYGESNPLPAPYYSTDKLKYLTSQQALADAANFVTTMNATLSSPGPWVVFGCSYSGALSAWFRSKYPNLVVGSVAPSGPVLAQSNYTSYLGQFSKSAAPDCVAAARTASEEIASAVATTAGRAMLSTKFNACKPLQQKDVPYFLWTLESSVGSQDQMNNPPTWILNTTCDMLTSSAATPIDNFVEAFNFANGASASASATGGFASVHTDARDGLRKRYFGHVHTTAGRAPAQNGQPRAATAAACNVFTEADFLQPLTAPNNNGRSWWYQKCNEFGFFKPSYTGTSVFFDSPTVERLVGYCAAIFGVPKMAPQIEYTNNYYGGKQLRATDVMFTNGLLDPWHLLSITRPAPGSGVQSVVYEAGHCGPLIQATAQDPPSLVRARQVVTRFLATLLRKAKAKATAME